MVVTDVPVVRGNAGPEPSRLVARVLVSGVNAASMRAVNYARTLDVDDVRAVHFAFSREDARAIPLQFQVGDFESPGLHGRQSELARQQVK